MYCNAPTILLYRVGSLNGVSKPNEDIEDLAGHGVFNGLHPSILDLKRVEAMYFFETKKPHQMFLITEFL